jgi:hypothetical protein
MRPSYKQLEVKTNRTEHAEIVANYGRFNGMTACNFLITFYSAERRRAKSDVVYAETG